MASSSSSSGDQEKKKIRLRSSDGEEFVLEAAEAMQSEIIKIMIKDDSANETIPLRNVTAPVLAKVIQYCKKHAKSRASDDFWQPEDEDLKSWDSDFVKVDQGTLVDLMKAANYLEIQGLLDLTCKTASYMMKGKSPEEIRKIFHIKNDYIPEEEEEVRRDVHWAFE